MATLSNIRRLTDAGRDVAARDKTMEPNTAIELVRIFDQIDIELYQLVGAPPAHRRRRGWRGLWRRHGDEEPHESGGCRGCPGHRPGPGLLAVRRGRSAHASGPGACPQSDRIDSRRRLARRFVPRRHPMSLKTTAALSALLAAAAAVPGFSACVSADEAADQVVCDFASSPDMFNADIGDLRQLDTWQPGYGNSTSPQMRDSVATVFDTIAAEQPDAVFVAGDLVEGHWGADVDSTHVFGPVGSTEQREQAISRAGHFYYGEWAERFDTRGLTVYPAIGDHEVGDNPWNGTTGAYGAGNDFKRKAFPVYKRAWADVFDIPGSASRPVGTSFEDTAYAVYPCPDVLLVTVDVFRRHHGDVHASLTEGQLAWLDNVLDETTAETIIVQGHTPVVGPVRQEHSSGLMYEGGTSSPFWQTLVEHQVDLYLTGEVHTVTALRNQGVTQISHGGLIARGRLNYMVGQVYDDGSIDLQVKRFAADVDTSEAAPVLWATTDKRPYADVVYHAGTAITGTMSLDAAGAVAAAVGELVVAAPAKKKGSRR